MSERELNRQVARATGETVDAVQRIGFHVLGEELSEDGPLVFDWDAGQPAYLSSVLLEDDRAGRIEPLPSYDEEFEDELDEEYACAAA